MQLRDIHKITVKLGKKSKKKKKWFIFLIKILDFINKNLDILKLDLICHFRYFNFLAEVFEKEIIKGKECVGIVDAALTQVDASLTQVDAGAPSYECLT